MTRRLVLCALAALMLLPGSAAAATTIGDTASIVDSSYGGSTLLQTADPAGKAYAVPAGGVVTSVAAIASGEVGTATNARVLLFRGAGPTYTVVGGADLPFTGTGLAVYAKRTGPARIPVQAGDRLGVYGPVSAGVTKTTSTGTIAAKAVKPPAAGGLDFTAGSTTIPGGIQVSATIEPDADRDGWGDETQDGCPTDAAGHTGPCTTDLTVTMRARPTTIPRNDVSVLIGTVTAARRAPGATARLQLPPGLQLVVASTTGGECIAFTCSLGDIPAGQSRRVFVTVRALSSGLQTAGLFAGSALPDTNAADNSGTTQVQVSKQQLTTKPRLCKVPDLEGKKRKAARRALIKAGCKPGRVRGKRGRRYRVRTQAVPAGVRVAAGTKVAFRLRKKPKEG